MPIIVNSKFRPFSFQEMIQPVLMASQAHQSLEDQYAALDATSSVWDKLQYSDIDKDVYNQYKAYSDAIKSASDELAQHGLTPSSRRSMLDLKARYAREIAPIEQAWNERDRQIKLQQEMMTKDPTHMYRVEANQVGLRNYMNNPSYDALSDNYSGALLTKQASEIAANLKTALTDKSKLKSLGLPYQYERELQYGYTPEQVDAAIRGDKNASPVLTRIIDQVLQSSGITNWDNYGSISDRVRSFIGQGIYSAIGTQKSVNFTDDYNKQEALNRNQYRRQNPDTPIARRNNLLNPLPLRSQQELDKNNRLIEEFKKYFFTKDGQLTLSREGLAEYLRTEASPVSALEVAGLGTEARKEVPSKFRQFMDMYGAAQYIKNIPSGDYSVQLGNIGNVFNRAIEQNKEGSYDTYHSTEYDRQLDSSYGDAYMKQIVGKARTIKGQKKVEVVEFTGKNGWKTTDEIPITDLAGYTVSDIMYSRYGNTAILYKDGQEPIRIKLPKGINTSAESNVDIAIANADAVGLVLYTGLRPATDSNNNIQYDRNGNIVFTDIPLTSADRIVLQEQQDQYLSDMGSYGSQIVVPSKTSTEEYKPFRF